MQDAVIRTRTGATMKRNNVPIRSRRGRPKLEIHPPEAGKNSKFKYPMTKTRLSRFEHLNFCH